MKKLITLLSGLALTSVLLVLGGCSCGHYGPSACYDYYPPETQVVIIEVPKIPDCGTYPVWQPDQVQSPPVRSTPIDRTPPKSTPPPRTKTPRRPRSR